MKKLIASFNCFEIELSEDVVAQCHHQGDCTRDVQECLGDKEVKDELDKLTPEQIKDELAEYGAWDDEQLENHQDNLERILWIACGNIQEERV